MSPHVAQIYTGYSILSRKGFIRLRQELSPVHIEGVVFPYSYNPKRYPGVFVSICGGKILFYDLHDSRLINEPALELADVYFKRSYVPAAIPGEAVHKVYPLGFNYEVYAGKMDLRELQRVLHCLDEGPGMIKSIVRALSEFGGAVFWPTVGKMSSPPNYRSPPKVLFMVRAWDPDSDPIGLPIVLKEERDKLNTTRAECIRLLKKEFGSSFLGGFIRSSYTLRRFPDLVLDDSGLAAKGSYIRLLQRYPICIASAGLHGSIGWKMGEYVAFSKAIISETFYHTVPGDFECGVNYWKWETPGQCVEKASLLFNDRQIREGMMESNWKYYQEYLSPERLILRTLKIAMEGN